MFLLILMSQSNNSADTKPAESKFQGDLLLRSIKTPTGESYRLQFRILRCCVQYDIYGDFTLAKDEAFGDYHLDVSQKSNRHIRVTVKTYEKTGV